MPRSATRVSFVVKMNSAYIRADGSEDQPGLDGRFDLQLNQGLPFMDLFNTDWEMLVGVRNLFQDPTSEASIVLGRAVRQLARAACSSSSSASTSAAWPSGLTFGQVLAIRPSGSTRNVVRAVPQYDLP